ncbi:cell cycle protein [Thermocrinis albus DSM 14484]|uniref:Probable peptidoglycan glycosyltransferase FtsW n=1 Tax=Thermocrinis albus (strain DSM 14484 / JCM 11386 / HI 11/12) TaxID=638303 RepID=D3SLT1_THEAH|nr:FtsW/RodA/SpoVE family cell cycle protein [Thermocrinis albus]ADC89711.1 cell cycle protein [Thermocrinis albus DSM 14484]
MDRYILTAVLLLFCMGYSVVLSVNLIPFLPENYSKFSIYKRPLLQLASFLVGLALARWLSFQNYRVLLRKEWLYSLVGVSTLSLIAVLVKKWATGKAVERWLIGGSLQPLELVKVSLILFVSGYIAIKGSLRKNSYMIWVASIVLLQAFLVSLQPDKGGAVFLLVLALTIMYVGGIPFQVYIPFSVVSAVFVLFLLNAGYVSERINAWKDPFVDAEDTGYQILQSLYAFARGGLWGVGIGRGLQGRGSLPEADTDYALSVIGEEWGFVGVTLVTSLYALLVFRLLYLSLKVNEPFGRLILLGAGVNFALSFLWNGGMAMNLLPPKGIALPFVSYGVSNLLGSMILLGLCFSVIREYERYRTLSQLTSFKHA